MAPDGPVASAVMSPGTTTTGSVVSGAAGAPWTARVPESVKVEPSMGRKTQSYEFACRVSLRMPKVEALRTWLVGRVAERPWWPSPPVPTVNWVMP